MSWLIGALFIGSVVPVTFKIVMPTNKKLLGPGQDLSSAETRALLDQRRRLHQIRSALSLVAFAIFSWLPREA
ncbi:DUF1772 domain-containing protein [bacterium AH-315-E07]|nr:DUF1772 domain-containing protein [bacterium AH-315-E07]